MHPIEAPALRGHAEHEPSGPAHATAKGKASGEGQAKGKPKALEEQL